jgi:hypothetical protein
MSQNVTLWAKISSTQEVADVIISRPIDVVIRDSEAAFSAPGAG